VIAAGDGRPELTAFQLEVARMFFALPPARASCWPGEQPCLHSTLRDGLPRTSPAGRRPGPYNLVPMTDTAGTVPGLSYLPGWLDEDAQRELLGRIDAAPWSAQLRRRVQHYGHRYDYGRRAVAESAGQGAAAIPDWARALAARLYGEAHLGQPADQVIVNEYLPGQGISAHVDCVPCFGPVVAAVSLGSACIMDFTSPQGADQVPVWLAPGSLSVMTGPARYAWRHAIAARKSDPAPGGRAARGRRVSVTFRTVLR